LQTIKTRPITNNLSTEVNYSSSGGTWEGGSFGSSGAAYSFVDPNGGNDVVYATDNDGSGLYRLQYESGSFTVSRVSTAAGASSQNDGAGCADEEDPHDPDSGSSGPSDISSTVSQSLGTCSGGSATSTLSITNNSSATGYYYVQYKIDSGSYQNASTNLSVSAGSTNTSLTQSVSSGSTITWRYIDSDTSNDFTGLSYTTLSTSSTVSSCTTTFTTSTSAGSCSGSSSTPSISVTNSGNTTGYFDVQWSTNNSTWTTLQNENAISSGGTETYSVSSAQSHGTTVYFQVRSGLSNPSSGSYTAASSVTVSCETLTFTLAQSMGSCSGGQQVPSITVTNTGSVTGYFDVQYKLTLDGSDITGWNTLKNGVSIGSSSHLPRNLIILTFSC
jgi:hypothetical protein